MAHRVLHIIPSLDRAGAEKQLALLVCGLPKKEFDVHVCAMTRGGPLAEDLRECGVPLTVLGKRWKIDPLGYAKVQRLVCRLKPDLVHTWMFAAGAYGRAAALVCGVKHLVASERCADHWKAGYQFAIDRFLARRSNYVVANSPGVRDYGAAHGMPAERYRVIPNGVPESQPSKISRAALLEQLHLPNDVQLIAAIGRLWPQKRVKDLIWNAELMHVVNERARLLVIGDGPQRRMLEGFTSQLGADEFVRFLGHRDDVPQILPHVDVLWQGSDYEGLPNAVMEAMAAGKPVVATDIPGNRDLVTRGETGFLVPLGGRKEFVRETQRILENPDLARRLGETGRRRVREQFSVQQMIDQHAELYREILQG